MRHESSRGISTSRKKLSRSCRARRLLRSKATRLANAGAHGRSNSEPERDTDGFADPEPDRIPNCSAISNANGQPDSGTELESDFRTNAGADHRADPEPDLLPDSVTH